jgi:2-methylcitrate dehydratase PrpD
MNPAATYPAEALSRYAASLRYEDLPANVNERIKFTIIDTVAACIGGVGDSASAAAIRYAARQSGQGKSRLLDGSGVSSLPGNAALVNGILAHALEADSLRRPSAGVHPGAVLVPAALAMGQHGGCSGSDLICAVAAGVEVMFRIGTAMGNSSEPRGFHAPGVTGPFGAAIAAAHILNMGESRTAQALGIAGSLASGVMEFAASGSGSMVKKLHLGRAAEGGVLAASLANEGFSGPRSILEGRFGVLSVFGSASSPELLTDQLGLTFESLNICFKKFPCHITAHAPIEGVLELRRRHGFSAGDIESITVAVNPKAAHLNAEREPADSGVARYSICFSVAVALTGDPLNPPGYESALSVGATRDLARRVTVQRWPEGEKHDPWFATVEVLLRNGQCHGIAIDDFPGSPTRPFDEVQIAEKFMRLTARMPATWQDRTLERLLRLEAECSVDWIGA